MYRSIQSESKLGVKMEKTIEKGERIVQAAVHHNLCSILSVGVCVCGQVSEGVIH